MTYPALSLSIKNQATLQTRSNEVSHSLSCLQEKVQSTAIHRRCVTIKHCGMLLYYDRSVCGYQRYATNITDAAVQAYAD